MKTMTKKMILGVAAAAILNAGTPSVNAGDCEWATAGKILTGVFAGTVLARALEPAPCPAYTTTVYPAPTVVYQTPVATQPAPNVVYQTPVVAQASPTVVYQTAAVVQPATVVVYPTPVAYPPPVVVRPAPVISFGIGFGPRYPYRPYSHHHHGW
jgi:hypothetical protein